MSRARRAWPTSRATSLLPCIVSFGIVVCCAACGQTGPLTLDRPADATAITAPADGEPAEPAEPDEPAERGEGEADGGAAAAGER